MPIFARIRSVHIALLICIYFVLIAVNYARALPPFEAADEAAHFLYAHNLLEDGDLPRILPREVVAAQTDPADQWAIESHQPPLYYAIGALLISMVDRTDINRFLRPNNVIFTRGITENNHNKWLHPPADFDGSTPTAVWILRAYSIMLGVGTLWFIFLAARQISNGPLLSLGAMFLVASIPTFVSISASINNDNGVTFLYTIGVYLCLRVWQQQHISNPDLITLSGVLALIALTKLTGASLFGVVFLALTVGVYRGYWSRMRAIQAFAVMLGTAAIVAGWWYLRNWSLYGDPLSLGATRSLWGREFEIAATSGDPLAELERIAQSFWMMFGHLHLPVYGPGWVYIYAAVITVLGLVGLAVYAVRGDGSTYQRDSLLLLTAVCGLITAMLLVGTRSVDISYGRLLFPALVGFAPLLLIGWRRALGPFALLLIIPLAAITVNTPQATIAPAYPVIELTEDMQASINATADDRLTLLGYALYTRQAAPSDQIVFEMDITGTHPENPLLAVTVVDPLTSNRLGYTEIYPGIAPTDALDPDRTYRARVQVPLDEVGDEPLRPRQLRLRLDWIPPTATEQLPWVDGAGTPIDALFVDGPILDDPRYGVDEPSQPLSADFVTQYDGSLQLDGFTLPDATFAAGDDLPMTLHWAGGTALEDWTLTVQLLDRGGNLVTQADAPIPGYPTSAWLHDVPFTSVHTLILPADAAPGTHQIVIGWYRQEDDTFVRMDVLNQSDSTGLLVLTQAVRVE